jgi:hypothetical protein
MAKYIHRLYARQRVYTQARLVFAGRWNYRWFRDTFCFLSQKVSAEKVI